jgi:hypothetical protein
VHAQHDLDAMSVLLRDPEQILSEHELPRHRGITRVIGPTPANRERRDALAPAPASDFRVANRAAVFEEEEMLMVDFAGREDFSRNAKWRSRISSARGQSSTSRSSCVLVRSLSCRRKRALVTDSQPDQGSTGGIATVCYSVLQFGL